MNNIFSCFHLLNSLCSTTFKVTPSRPSLKMKSSTTHCLIKQFWNRSQPSQLLSSQLISSLTRTRVNNRTKLYDCIGTQPFIPASYSTISESLVCTTNVFSYHVSLNSCLCHRLTLKLTSLKWYRQEISTQRLIDLRIL